MSVRPINTFLKLVHYHVELKLCHYLSLRKDFSESGSFEETNLFPESSQGPIEFQPIALTAQTVIALHSAGQLSQVDK